MMWMAQTSAPDRCHPSTRVVASGCAKQEKNRMGLEQTVTFAEGTLPPWNQISDLLARHGFPVQVRMIDNELAFPDEVPPETWRELRLGTPQGMVTLRRESRQVAVVTWGNADAGLLQ